MQTQINDFIQQLVDIRDKRGDAVAVVGTIVYDPVTMTITVQK